MIPKRIIINIIWQSYYSKIDHRLRYIGVNIFSNELNCKKSLNLIQYLEDDILNYSSIVIRGTPCINIILKYRTQQRNWVLAANSNFLIPLSLQSDDVNLWKEYSLCHKFWFSDSYIFAIQCRRPWYFKLWIMLEQMI